MKILITGAGGMYGSHLCESLCFDGHEVIGIDNLQIGYEDNIISHPNFLFHKVDITDFDSLSKIFPTNVDIVYHTACIPFESFSPWIPSKIINSIVCGTTNVATLSIQNKVKRFINFSTTGRYLGHDALPFVETMKPKPLDPYSVAKVSAENILKNFGEIHNFEHLNIIPHSTMGSRSIYTSPYRNVICIWINQILQGKAPYIYGNGTNVRSYSFPEDQIDLLKKFINCDLKENGECFNIGGNMNKVSLNELYDVIKNILKFDKPAIYVKGGSHQNRMCIPSVDKIKKRFEYESKISLEEGIENIINYIKERGPKSFEYNLELEINNEKTPTTWRKKLI